MNTMEKAKMIGRDGANPGKFEKIPVGQITK
jgi:hypothetical protein